MSRIHVPAIPGVRGPVLRYPLGMGPRGPRELRVTSTRGLLVLALHDDSRCTSGPLTLPLDAVDTLRSALADVLGENGPEAATDGERATTRKPGGPGATP